MAKWSHKIFFCFKSKKNAVYSLVGCIVPNLGAIAPQMWGGLYIDVYLYTNPHNAIKKMLKNRQYFAMV